LFIVFSCLGLLSYVELCIFLCRLVLLTLMISFVSKGFPYNDEIVMVYCMYSQHVTFLLIFTFLTATYLSKARYSLFVLKVPSNPSQSINQLFGCNS